MPDESPQPPKKSSSPMMMMMMMLLMMMLLFDPTFRTLAGDIMGSVMHPLIGFEYKYPVLTILLAGLFTATITTLVRHIFTNWVEMAKAQSVSGAFNKEMREARKSGNAAKLKKLTEMQPEVMKKQMDMQSSQMKSMPVTMLVVVPIFIWLWTFIDGVAARQFSTPWSPSVDFLTSQVCLFPNWIVIYSLLSIPFSQVFQRTLKMRSLGKKRETPIPEGAPDELALVISSLDAYDERLEDMDGDEGHITKARGLVKEARASLKAEKVDGIKSTLEDIEYEIGQARKSANKAEKAIEEAREVLEKADIPESELEKAQAAMDEADEAMEGRDYASVIYYSKQAKRHAKDAVGSRIKLEAALEEARELLESAREKGMDTEDVEKVLANAAESLEDGNPKEAATLLGEVQDYLNRTVSERDNAERSLKDARNVMTEAGDAGIENRPCAEMLKDANRAWEEKRYGDVSHLSKRCSEQMRAIRKKSKRAEDALSMGKLIAANAQSFGADTSGVFELLQEAKYALDADDYDKALKLAEDAKTQAEEAKEVVRKEG